jgi:hypothetical protein
LERIEHDFRGYHQLCWWSIVEDESVTLVFSLRGGPAASGQTTHFQFAGSFPPVSTARR